LELFGLFVELVDRRSTHLCGFASHLDRVSQRGGVFSLQVRGMGEHLVLARGWVRRRGEDTTTPRRRLIRALGLARTISFAIPAGRDHRVVLGIILRFLAA
jgi:hypothetical protein